MSDRDAEAAHWFARMRAAASEADRAAFEAWRADPDNAAAYARAEDDWLLVGGAAPEAIAVHRNAPSRAERRGARWALAAALVLGLSLGVAWMISGSRDRPNVADNATGDLILEDGTRVALKDGARLEAQFKPNERRVMLVGGRALFTVAHDSKRPFRVVAAGSETTALGTIFEVDLRGAQPVVHLIKGLVEVRNIAGPGAPLLLRPGQRATVAGDKRALLVAQASEQLPMQSPVRDSEAAHLLIADEIPLGAVLDRANRVNIAKIEVADRSLADRPVSGRFDVADAKSLSHKLAAALDLSVEDRSGNYLLIPKIKN